MQRLFIADLHLQPCYDTQIGTNPLQQIITNNADIFAESEEIYFLGDVFEYWLGIDHGELHYHAELATLKALTQKKKCFFIRGNRDVLFSQHDAQALNLTLLTDPYVLNLSTSANNQTLLTHGDSWTTQKLHRLYRRISLSTVLQQTIRALSIEKRIKLATFLRKNSRGNRFTDNPLQPNANTINKETQASIKLNQHANFDYFSDTFNYDTIICGHFHRPGIYQHKQTTIYQLGNLRNDQDGLSVYALISTANHNTLTLLTTV